MYGAGAQTRGFLDLPHTVRCIDLAVLNPAAAGEMRTYYDQFTEQFSVLERAERVARVIRDLGLTTRVEPLPNPRIEEEKHFYQAKHTKLINLGLHARLLSDDTVPALLRDAVRHRDRINLAKLLLTVTWSRRNVESNEALLVSSAPDVSKRL